MMGTASSSARKRSSASVLAALFVAALAIALIAAIAPKVAAYAADDSAGGSNDASAQLATAAITSEQATLDAQVTWSTIKPGVYYIQSQLNGMLMLDVDGASKASGANVQIYTSNSTAAQRWRVIKASDGTYKIRNVGSGKYLDIDGQNMQNGTNVQQWQGNKTKAQRWKMRRSGSGYVIASAADTSYVLDVKGGKAGNFTNVQIYKSNGSAAQEWWLTPAKPKVESKRVLKNGVYELRLTSAPSFVVDSASDRLVNGSNVELNKRDGSLSQRWFIYWNKKGYYTIHNVSTGKVIDVEGDSPAVRANVQSWATNGTDAQHWAISKNPGGSFTIRCMDTGHALDVAGARAANGTNVRVMATTRGASQRFSIKRIKNILPNDTYVIYSMLAPLKSVVNMPGASKASGVQAQLYSASGSMAERFYLRRVSGNVYGIQSASSGMYLADDSGKALQKKRSSSKAQQWKASFSGSGLAFTNVATGKRLSVAGGSTTNGTKIVTEKASSKNAQRFRVVSTRLIPDGYYTLSNAASNRRLDVDGGSVANNANVQVYNANKTAAQVWKISYVNNGYYKLVNDGSAKALDVVGASKDNHANVQQYTDNNSDAQHWRPILRADGSITFINESSSMALEAAGTQSGANVRQGARVNTAAQGWYLTSTISRSLSGNTELDTYIRKIVDKNDGSLKKCFNWLKTEVTRVNSMSTTTPATGIVAKDTTITQALSVFKNKKADSYYFASAMKWLAIGCGYDAEARAGKVSTTTGDPIAHGWTEVYSNGQTFICDVDLAKSIGGTQWYMTTYETAPLQYYL